MIRNEMVSHLGDKFASIGSHLKEIDLQDNLLSKWEEVLALGPAVPNLSVLLLHGNKLEALSPAVTSAVPAGCFSNLRVLALNFCNIKSWAEIQCMEHLVPNLQELYIANNRFPDLPRRDAEQAYRDATGVSVAPPAPPTVTGFANMRIIDLSQCDLEEWSQVLAFGDLPNLQECVIDANPKLTKVLAPDEGTFQKLVRFSISATGLGSWEDIDTLSHYPALTMLRLNQIPLFTGKGASEVRPFIIGRMKDLAFFNGSAVSARERIDSEKIYLRSILRERDYIVASTFSNAASAGSAIAEVQKASSEGVDSAVDTELILVHPRFKELQSAFAAELLPVGDEQQGHTIAADLINITFRNLSFGSGGTLEPIVKKLPKSLTILKLRMLVKQLFGLDPKLQDLSLRLYKNAVPFVMDDDESTLMYYGAIEGADIFINEAKKG